MEEDERGLRSEEEEALIEDLEKEKGKRKAAEEEEGLEMECLGREMAEEVKSWRDCVIVKVNEGIWRKGIGEWKNGGNGDRCLMQGERRRCRRREQLRNCRRKIDGPKRLKPFALRKDRMRCVWVLKNDVDGDDWFL